MGDAPKSCPVLKCHSGFPLCGVDGFEGLAIIAEKEQVPCGTQSSARRPGMPNLRIAPCDGLFVQVICDQNFLEICPGRASRRSNKKFFLLQILRLE